MNGKFNEGDRLVLTLITGENFEGDCVRGTDKRIEIRNILHYESGNRVDSTWCFYKREINSVHKIKDSKKNDNTTLVETKKDDSQKNAIEMDREEYERLKDVARNYAYIKFDDNTYYEALKDIANFESVGVFAIGSEQGRNGRISIIALSTWKKVYIFDLKSFRTKRFPGEIAEILESFYIKKVVHNAGPLKACLKHVHNISINNIFDTLVSQLLIAKASGRTPATLSNIGECLTEYYNFPSTLLASSLESLKDSWDNRPLPEDKIEKISRLTTYLITIKDHQMELMLKNYNRAMDDFHNLYIKCSEFEGQRRIVNQKFTNDMDKIIPCELLGKKEEN